MPQFSPIKTTPIISVRRFRLSCVPSSASAKFKKSLGHDYPRAVCECKRFAVEADNLIADARCKLDNIPVDPYSQEGIRRTRHVRLTAVTPELEKHFGNLIKASLLETDQEARIARTMGGTSKTPPRLFGAGLRWAM